MKNNTKNLLTTRTSPLNLALTLVTLTLTLAILLTFLANISIAAQFSEYEETLASFPTAKERLNIKVGKIKEQTDAMTYICAINDKIREVSNGRIDAESALRYSVVIAEESKRYDIDPLLILAIIATESSFRKDVVSHKGARGLMQLLPATALYISKKTQHIDITNPDELFDEEKNLRLGVAYLAYLQKKTGSTEHAVIAYNYGPANLKRAITSNSQLPKKYMRTVMGYYNKMTKDSEG